MNWLGSFFGRVPLASCEKASSRNDESQSSIDASEQRKNAAKAGFMERRRQKKADYTD